MINLTQKLNQKSVNMKKREEKNKRHFKEEKY